MTKRTKCYPPRGRGRLRFDADGHLIGGSFPADCIRDCSASGQVKSAVAYWRDKLRLAEILEPYKSLVIRYLREYGAWDDFGVATIEELADRVLWTACCDIKENGEWFGLTH